MAIFVQGFICSDLFKLAKINLYMAHFDKSYVKMQLKSQHYLSSEVEIT
ncbi:hypothetical protein PPEP_a2897 [Pseudoalteromonas peptidolytica F12-50-A1]|uniref:Uncharacterized protein n=1 Tax=Pseudoalteromonas peptidolytica F12-50-A1 TaxID=1315280 RepID=A0A8I0MWH3_9GAMM|nr:hypothetical protein [Pseudoalteromonas peptidolytica F12-50-A1]